MKKLKNNHQSSFSPPWRSENYALKTQINLARRRTYVQFYSRKEWCHGIRGSEKQSIPANLQQRAYMLIYKL
jgi:hypothetical protein